MTTTIREAISNPTTRDAAKKAIHYDLTLRAFHIVTRNLERFGNTLGDEHRAALMELVGDFTLLSFGLKKGRYAYPLPTGMGKTQSIVAFCAALYELGYKGVSIAVSASKVEALAQLKRDLISNGVPAEDIGLIHAYKYDASLSPDLPEGYASEPATEDNDDRPIMLVTHNRIKKGRLEHFNSFKGKPRNLLIWDESLLVSHSRVLSHKYIKKAFGFRLPDMPEACVAVRYFNKAINVIDTELERQKAGGMPLPLALPPLSETEMDTVLREVGNGPVEEPLRELLRISQEPLRVAYTQQDGGLITYDITVPKELTSIAILDASYPIRVLEKMDSSIKLGGHFSSNMKRYDYVKLHHLKSPSGRKSITDDFSNIKREDRKVSREVCDLISGIPAEEGVIVFTFKKAEGVYRGRKPVDFKKLLRDDLKAAGVDINARLPEGDRIVMLTWGQETSLSQYSYCKHVVFAGVLHRSHLSLASEIVGQVDNLMHNVTSTHIEEVMVSEIAHYLYQAMSRGSCRKIEGNQAQAMDAWLIHGNDSVRSLMEQVMPGLKWLPWKPTHLITAPVREKLATEISGYLGGLSDKVSKLSTTSLKKSLGLESTPRNTFTRALAAAVSNLEGWSMSGRSVVRDTAPTFSEHFEEAAA